MPVLDSILNTYAVIFFTRNRWLGAVLLGCTLLAPRLGLFGLAGVMVALLTARAVGYARATIEDGSLLFNSLLVSLALGYLSLQQAMPWTTLALLLVFFSMITVFCTAATNRWVFTQFGLPALSLPFVAVCFGMYFAFYAIQRTPLAGVHVECLIREPAGLPDAVTGFLQSFSAIFFLPHAGVGLLILIAVLFHSRLALVFAVLAYAAGRGMLMALGVDAGSAATVWMGFNAVFCGLALGGFFYVPGRAGLALAVLAGCGCAITGLAAKIFLLNFNIPPLALPFNLVTLGLVFALRQRATFRGLLEPTMQAGSPEDLFRKSVTERLRFPDLHLPALLPPFHGVRTVTQSFDGPVTHRDGWRHAFDFEVRDEQDRPAPRDNAPLADYYTMGFPVLAPGAGVVTKVVDHIPDNRPGDTNLDENWGNLVILLLDSGVYVKLGHLRQKSIAVREGDRVAPGALLGQCGNSGRSPIPHLHVQMQASPLIGSTTVPFRLVNYIETTGDLRVFRASGVPATGSLVEPLQPDPRLTASVESMTAHTATYRVHSPAGDRIETLECGIDSTGRHAYHSRETGACLAARVVNKVWYALDYQGGPDSLLYWMWMALPRIPLTRDARLTWEDQIDVRPLLRRPFGWAADLCMPFLGLPMIGLQCRLAQPQPDRPAPADEIEVETTPTLPFAPLLRVRPRKVTACLGRGATLERIRVESDAGDIEITRQAP